MARGWGGKEKLPTKDDVKKLKIEVDNLQKKKSKIKSEISVAVNRAVEVKTKKMDSLFANEVADLNITHDSKIKQLEAERTAVKKQSDNLQVKDKAISERENSVSARESKAQILEDKNIRTSISLENKEAQNKSYIEVENAKISDREHNINIKKEENTAKASQLIRQEIDLDDQEARQKATQKQLDSQQLENNKESARIVYENKTLETFKEETLTNLADSEKTKVELDKKLKAAQDLYIEIDTLQAKLDKDKLSMDNMTDYVIPDIRTSLKEREATVKDKEKYLILRQREIDAKIKILKQLRAGN